MKCDICNEEKEGAFSILQIKQITGEPGVKACLEC